MSSAKNKSTTAPKPCRFHGTVKGCNKGEACRFVHVKDTNAPAEVVVHPDHYTNANDDYTSLLRFYVSRRPVVSMSDELTIDYAAKHQVQVWLDERKGKDDHPISGLCRTEAGRKKMIFAITHLLAERPDFDPNHLTVVDWHGATRESVSSPQPGTKLGVQWINCPDIPIGGDAARGFRREPIPDYADVAFVTDVYHGIGSTPEAIRPFDVLSAEYILGIPGVTSIYLTQRQFVGVAGAEVYRYEKEVREEGAWVENPAGLIDFSPHPNGQLYPPHPKPFFGSERSVAGLDVAELAIVGPYHLYRITRTLEGAVPLAPVKPVQPRFYRTHLNECRDDFVSLWARRVGLASATAKVAERLAWLKGEPYVPKDLVVTVDRDMLSRIPPSLRRRPVSGIAIDAVALRVMGEVSSDSTARALQARFPDEYAVIQEGTMLMAKYGGRERRAHLERELRHRTFKADSMLAQARQTAPFRKEGSTLPSNPLGLVGTVVLTLLVMFLMGLQMQPASVSHHLKLLPVFQSFREWLNTSLPWTVSVAMRPLAALLRALGAVYHTLCEFDLAVPDVPEATSNELSMVVGSRYERVSWALSRLWSLTSPYHGAVRVILLGPFFEELLTAYAPTIACLLFAWEACLIATFYPGFAWIAVLIVHLTCYALSRTFGFVYGLGLHVVWNYATWEGPLAPAFAGVWALCAALLVAALTAAFWPCLSKNRIVTAGVFDLWLERYYRFERTHDTTLVVEPLPVGTSIKSVNSEIAGVHTDGVRGSLSLLWDGSPVTPQEAFVLASELPKPDQPWWPLVVTNGTMYATAKSEVNLLAGLFSRTHRALPPDRPSQDVLLSRWLAAVERLQAMACLQLYDPILRPERLEEALSSQKSSRRDQIVAAKKAYVDGLTKSRKGMFIKTKEHLPAKSQKFAELDSASQALREAFAMTTKPRLIADLDLQTHALTAVVSKAIGRLLMTSFSGQEFRFEYNYYGETLFGTVRIFWCAGRHTAAPGSANDCYHSLLNGLTTLGVCGDDHVVGWGDMTIPGWYKRYADGDFSMMDSTLDAPISQKAFSYWALLLGATPFEAQCLAHHMGTQYRASVGHLKVRGDSEVQFTTGSTLTSTHQTFITILVVLSIMADPCTHPVDTVEKFGMKMKFSETDDVFQLQFLHLLYLPVINMGGSPQFQMCPMPGAILKWGKVSADPVLLTKQKGCPKDEQSLALRKVAYAVAISHPEIPFNFPVLGPFLVRLRELGAAPTQIISRDSIIENYAYKARVTKFYMDAGGRDFALIQFAKRYGVEVAALLEVEALIRAAPSLPVFIQHPLFELMAKVDYG